MIGIIGGTGLYEAGFPANTNWKTKEKEIKTRYGSVHAMVGEELIFIPRHGKDRNVPPHMINHRANIAAFEEHGVREVVGIGSVGSLKKEMPPGSIIIPDDYINPGNIQTFFDSEIVHITPCLDADLRGKIISVAKGLGIDVIEWGIYVQTMGPRLETRAEVFLMKDHADVVGMTLASEATLAREKGISYAAICQVDNYAHGLVGGRLDFREVVEEASGKRGDLKRLLGAVVEGLK